MENLTKQQIVLLTLLVSFVTSIATGIVTVALMNQVPTGIVQTINRVVERTIETVTPAPSNTKETIVKETVVVKADDLVVSAIDKNTKSVLRIYRTNSDPVINSESMAFVSLGIVISDDGIVATDGSLVSESGRYFTTLSDGKLYSLSILRTNPDEQVALLKVNFGDSKIQLDKAVISSKTDLKLGQTVVYIGGEGKNVVSTGIVSSLGTKEIKTETASSTASSTQSIQTVVSSIETNISSSGLISGAPIVNLSGEVVGIKMTFLDSARNDLFAPSKLISDSLTAFLAEQKKP